MPRRLTHHHYEALARERGFEWLGEEVPKNIREKTTWRCSEGHCWEIPYRNIKYDGSGCPYCAGLARKQAADYHALAERRGFEWLWPLVDNAKTRTQWRCSERHLWLATYNSIGQGSGCPTCAGLKRKTEADYRALAKRRGFEWLGPMVGNVRTKTKWRCAEKHTWLKTYNAIQQGAGCPMCAGHKRKTGADYHALAKRRGFEWLGPLVNNTQTKTQWQCSKGHTWLATYGSIRQRSHCPICSPRAPKSKVDYHALAEQRGFEWLGPPVKNVKTKTQWRCGKGHTWWAIYNSIRQGSGCPICARSKRKAEADYHALAKRRSLEWLGPPVTNVNEKTQWRCAKKHTWFATYNGIRLRGKCPTCARYDNQPKLEADYYILADLRGFLWLGPPVKNTKTGTRWQCSNGHTWFTTYNSIKQGSGCRECLQLKRKQ